MSAHPHQTMTVDEFVAWSQAQPREAGRFELWDGHVVVKHGAAGEMNAERSQHWKMKAAIYRAFYAAFNASGSTGDVVIDGASVRLPSNRLVEPDVLVYLGPELPPDVLVVPDPVIVCEVLSPATAKFDMSLKLEGYFALPSIHHYIIADPDKPLLIVHTRGAGTALQTRIISDNRHPLSLDPPGLRIDLADIFGR
jgi:Uma2 family endonuclease